jgi:subtilisin family serine protease
MKMPTEPQQHDSEIEFSLRLEDVLTELDPELQNAILSLREGLPLPRYLYGQKAEGGEVVDVIARLRRPGAEVEGLNVSQRIGQIVTGTVAVKDIVKVRTHRDVLGLKGARRLQRMLADSVAEIRASSHQLRNALLEMLPKDFGDLDGSGVIVGIVDNGCDFAHRNFRKVVGGEPGPTRILSLWDQRVGADETAPEGCVKPPHGYDYGREFSAEALDDALCEAPPSEGDPDAPHRHLGYEISADDGHGTRVMDVAAGSGGGKFPPGVAPGADIIFVESSLGNDAEVDASLGNSRRILEAVKYIFDKASELKKPAVVNISLNYYGGPHDGTTPVEEAFDVLLETPGRAIVIAAGNSRNTGTHVRRVVHPNQACTLFWGVSEGDDTDNKLEVWYEGRHRLELTLTPPGCTPLGPVRPASTFTLLRGGEKAGRVFNRLDDSSNGDNHIVVLLDAYAKEGVWKLELRPLGDHSFAPFAVHAWIERDNNTSTFLDARDEDRAYTLGTLACGHSTIAVTGYDALNPESVHEAYSEGPTRDGKLKPEVSAPGTNLLLAAALIDTVNGPHRGTSLAAPHVTGLAALLMQAAREPLTIEATRALVIGSARCDPPSPGNTWDSRYGAGRVDRHRDGRVPHGGRCRGGELRNRDRIGYRRRGGGSPGRLRARGTRGRRPCGPRPVRG